MRANTIPARLTYIAKTADPKGISIIAAAATLFALLLIVSVELDQTFSAAIIGLLIAGLALLRPQTAIAVTFIYLAFMGDLRRYLVVQSGIPANDPLLLVAPAILVFLVAIAMVRREISLRSRISKLVLALTVIMGVEVMNPLQGGIAVGLAGLLFFAVPLTWYWVGSVWGSPQFFHMLLTRIVTPIAILAATLGLMQAFWGYLPYESKWFRIAMESSIRPDIRPFAFFCSWGEYPWYVATALIAILVPLVRRRMQLSLLIVPLFVFALVVQSVREMIYGTLLAASIIWAVQGKSTGSIGGRLILAMLVAGGVAAVGMSQLKEADVSDQVNKNLAHTADGFLDVQNSTAGTHLELLRNGIVEGFTHPAGYGLGFPTQAGLRAGGFSSEVDFGDIFLACGAPAGIFYIFTMAVIYLTAIARWRERRDPIALYALGIITLGLGHWLAGGSYATSPIVWFAIGSLDRLPAGVMLPTDAAARPVQPRRRPIRPTATVNARRS